MTLRLLRGDMRATLAGVESGSVQTCVTSPPYYGLRSYSTPPLVWGGDAEHEHLWTHTVWSDRNNAPGRRDNGRAIAGGNPHYKEMPPDALGSSQFCQCGAWLGHLGLEPTPELFVEHIVECFRAVRRVLRDDGSIWVNMGDSYAGSGKGPSGGKIIQHAAGVQPGEHDVGGWRKGSRGITDSSAHDLGSVEGYKAKDLMEIPSMVAQALRADGWYLRSRIPWLKRNAMPESVTDRPATSVEYVFLLSKSSRYYWDADAVRVGYADGRPEASRLTWESRKASGQRSGNRMPSSEHDPAGHMGTLGGFATGRNRRNGDWFFESWQGMLLDSEDDPLALVVNPAPFSEYAQTVRRVDVGLGERDDDTKRTESPTCPVHASVGQPDSSARGDEHGVASAGRHRKPGNGDRHALLPLFDSASTDPLPVADSAGRSSDSPRPERSDSATGHSTRSYRTDLDPSMTPLDTPSDGTARGIERTSAPRDDSDSADRNGASNSAADSSPGGPGSGLSGQTEPSNDDRCTCSYYREFTEKTSHYATFPPKLVEPMVKASTSEKGCCPECGAPWARVVDATKYEPEVVPVGVRNVDVSRGDKVRKLSGADYNEQARRTTTGWQPTCKHSGEPVPQTVLDCFAGANTTLLVADRLGRNGLGCELSESYSDMGSARLVGDAPMFVQLDGWDGAVTGGGEPVTDKQGSLGKRTYTGFNARWDAK